MSDRTEGAPLEGELGGPGVPAKPPANVAEIMRQALDDPETHVADAMPGTGVAVRASMNTPGVIHEKRNVPDHLISSQAKTINFNFDVWAVIPDGDPCTIHEALKAFATALARVPGHTVNVCNNHQPCQEDCE